jgi:hypothetical protein
MADVSLYATVTAIDTSRMTSRESTNTSPLTGQPLLAMTSPGSSLLMLPLALTSSYNNTTSLMVSQPAGPAMTSPGGIPTLSLALAVFFLSESALIIPLNMFTIAIIVRRRHHMEQSRVSRIMLSLLFADLSVGLALPLHSAFLLLPTLATIRYLCLVRTACNYVR